MYNLTKKAQQDISDILDYTLENFGSKQVILYYEALRRKFSKLSENPLLCRERKEFIPPVRIHHHKHHLIIYILQNDGNILIARVLHENMDIQSHISAI